MELSFTTGSIINVYGDMDDDGFYVGEIDGVRGLVPSNFLAPLSDQYNASIGINDVNSDQQTPGSSTAVGGAPRSQRMPVTSGGRGHGPGARGPPPPPRGVNDGSMGMSPSSTSASAGGMPLQPGQVPGSRSAPRGTKTGDYLK